MRHITKEEHERVMHLLLTIKRLDDMRILGIPMAEWDMDLQQQVMEAYVDTRDYEYDLRHEE
jgi:hypothetical protein